MPRMMLLLGISRVQKVLSFDIMTTSPKQEYAVSEFGTYEYDKKSIEKGKEVPVKKMTIVWTQSDIVLWEPGRG